jgi:hypothetical protein
LAAYSEYANAVKASSQLSYRIAAARGFPAGAKPIDIEAGLQALAETESERTVTWETVLLLGDPATVQGAREWHECLWRLEWTARGKKTGHDELRDRRLPPGDNDLGGPQGLQVSRG